MAQEHTAPGAASRPRKGRKHFSAASSPGSFNSQTPSHSESANLKLKGCGRAHLPVGTPSVCGGSFPGRRGGAHQPRRHQEPSPCVPRWLQGCGQMGTPPTPSQETLSPPTPRAPFFQAPASSSSALHPRALVAGSAFAGNLARVAWAGPDRKQPRLGWQHPQAS